MAKQTVPKPLALFIREKVRSLADKSVGLTMALSLMVEAWKLHGMKALLPADRNDTVDEQTGDSGRFDPQVGDIEAIMEVIAPHALALTQSTIADLDAQLKAKDPTAGMDLTGLAELGATKVETVLRRIAINPQNWVDK